MNTALMRVVKQSQFKLVQHAPTILTGMGVAGFVATTAFTIRATAKAVDILPKLRTEVETVKNEADDEHKDEKARSQDLAKVYLANAVVLTKIYAPTISLGTASILCVIAGHNLMLKRQARIAALYAALDTSYRAYRRRVAEKIGEEEEHNLYRRPNMRALDEEGENGETVEVIDFSDQLASPYAMFFDESNPNWEKNAEFNKFFLKQQETWANDRLRGQGYLFLNEVYYALGLPRTQYGQSVGWKLKENLDDSRDGFVSFGIEDLWDENKRAFVNGQERSVLLDFNVDGIIRI